MKTKRKLSPKQKRLKDALRTREPKPRFKSVGTTAYTLVAHRWDDTNHGGQTIGQFVGVRDLAREILYATKNGNGLTRFTVHVDKAQPGQESQYAAKPRNHRVLYRCDVCGYECYVRDCPECKVKKYGPVVVPCYQVVGDKIVWITPPPELRGS